MVASEGKASGANIGLHSRTSRGRDAWWLVWPMTIASRNWYLFVTELSAAAACLDPVVPSAAAPPAEGARRCEMPETSASEAIGVSACRAAHIDPYHKFSGTSGQE